MHRKIRCPILGMAPMVEPRRTDVRYTHTMDTQSLGHPTISIWTVWQPPSPHPHSHGPCLVASQLPNTRSQHCRSLGTHITPSGTWPESVMLCHQRCVQLTGVPFRAWVATRCFNAANNFFVHTSAADILRTRTKTRDHLYRWSGANSGTLPAFTCSSMSSMCIASSMSLSETPLSV